MTDCAWTREWENRWGKNDEWWGTEIGYFWAQILVRKYQRMNNFVMAQRMLEMCKIAVAGVETATAQKALAKCTQEYENEKIQFDMFIEQRNLDRSQTIWARARYVETGYKTSEHYPDRFTLQDIHDVMESNSVIKEAAIIDLQVKGKIALISKSQPQLVKA
jgi:hypothetical protein